MPPLIKNRLIGPGAMFAVLAILTAPVAGYSATPEMVPFVIADFEGRQPIGTSVHAAEVPVEHLQKIMGETSLSYLSIIDREFGQAAEFEPSVALDWRRNHEPRLKISAQSQLTTVVMDFENASTQSEFLLEIDGAQAVAWFLRDDRGLLSHHVDQFDKPRAARPLFDPNPVIPLRLDTSGPYRLYIYAYLVTSEGVLSLDLWNAESFRAQRSHRYLVDGVYYGLILAITISSVLLSLFLREVTYLLFAMFVSSSAAVIYIGSGLSTVFGLSDRLPLAFPLFFGAVALVGFFGGLLSIKLLDMWVTNRKLWYAYVGMAIYTFFATALVLWLVTRDLITTDAINQIYVMGAVGYLASTLMHFYALVYYFRRTRIALFWYIGISLHGWAMIVWTLTTSTQAAFVISPHYFLQVATIFDALLLQGLMFYNYRVQRQERMVAQQSALSNLRLAHDLERSKSTFVATVGHDLRGPVQAISHFTQSLKNTMPDAAQNGLVKIEENLVRISDLLGSMVKLSKIEWQASNQNQEQVDLGRLLSELENEFIGRAASKGLGFHVMAPAATVYSDTFCLGQVLRNLIDNALKYTDEGYVRVLVQELDEVTLVKVEDTGRGVPEGELEKIFGEFYQLSNPSRDTVGFGLGLSIVARLTKLLGIEMTVSSTVGQGSTFELCINRHAPLDSEDGDDDVGTPVPRKLIENNASAGTLSGTSVLQIADDAVILAGLVVLLEKWSADVSQRLSMDEAASWCSQHSPDLILIDAASYAMLTTDCEDYTLNLLVEQLPVLIAVTRDDVPMAGLRDNHHVIDSDIPPMRLRSLIQRI
ncbi:MAG: ATP-binding protein [Proteobacteria bacterium]|nr:ATP-binding protein [Pseudomonadota bacterium]